jgi:hypothetical protein
VLLDLLQAAQVIVAEVSHKVGYAADGRIQFRATADRIVGRGEVDVEGEVRQIGRDARVAPQGVVGESDRADGLRPVQPAIFVSR